MSTQIAKCSATNMFTGTGIQHGNTITLITLTFINSISIDFRDSGYWMNLKSGMIRKNRAILSLLLCLNIVAISLYGNLINFADNLHVMTTHQVAIDHHHHDAFSLHIDHDDINMVHQHAVDYVQNIAVLIDNNLSTPLLKVSRVHLPRFEQPASALIEAPFRPPPLPA